MILRPRCFFCAKKYRLRGSPGTGRPLDGLGLVKVNRHPDQGLMFGLRLYLFSSPFFCVFFSLQFFHHNDLEVKSSVFLQILFGGNFFDFFFGIFVLQKNLLSKKSPPKYCLIFSLQISNHFGGKHIWVSAGGGAVARLMGVRPTLM